MAITLKAVARLNTRPYLNSLKTLGKGTAALSKSNVQGTKAETHAVEQLQAAKKASAVASKAASKAAESGARSTSKVLKTVAVDAGELRRLLKETGAETDRTVKKFGRLTPAAAALEKARENVRTRFREFSTLAKGGVEGPPMDRAIRNLDSAAQRLGTALQRVQDQRLRAAKGAAAEEAQRKAMAQGLAEASRYANTLSRLNSMELKRSALVDAHANAQNRLAEALAKSNGLETAAVKRARTGVTRATGALKNFDEAPARAQERADARLAAQQQRLAAQQQKVAAATQARQAAEARGIKSAAAFARATQQQNLSDLKRTKILQRRAIAEARLASAMAKSNGVITPAVMSAQHAYLTAEEGLRKYEADQERVTKSTAQGLTAQRYLYGDMARMTARAALGLSVLPAAAVVAGAAWEKSFADVVRTSDPKLADSAEATEVLRKQMVHLVQTMPTSWGDVTGIATMANQMGIASNETQGFTEAVAMFSATSGVSAEETATAFGRLRTIVPDIGSDFMGLADSILKVGVNSVATESEIINIVTQISSIAGAAEFTDKEMIGLAGSLASVRTPPELSRGVITRVFGQISRAASSGGSSLDGFAKIAGMSSEEFASNWGVKGRSGEAFLSFMDGLRRLGPEAETALRSLGITSVRDVPILLRLSTAADAEGNVGGLLRQTFSDAQEAAGETQRQYSIMSETVAARMKVLGNNILAFFSAIGSSSLGPFGKVVDFISDKLQALTNSLDQNAKLFGLIELPFTNGELIGMATLLGVAAAGILALGSAVLKTKEILAGMRLLGGNLFGGRGNDPTGVGRIRQQWIAFPGQLNTAMRKTTNTLKSGYARMALTSERLSKSLNPMSRGALIYPMAGNRRRSVDPYIVQRAAAAKFGGAAESAANRARTAFSSVGSAVRTVGSGIGRAASVAFGPWGLLAGIATTGIVTWLNSTKGATTDASEMAEEIAALGDNFEAMGRKLESVQIGKLFGDVVKVFDDGFVTLSKLNKELEKAQAHDNSVIDSLVGGSSTLDAQSQRTLKLGESLRSDLQSKSLSDDYVDSVKKIDQVFGELVSSGNIAQASGALTKFSGTTQDLYALIDPKGARKRGFISKEDEEALKGSTKEMQKLYKAAFDMAGKKLNFENLTAPVRQSAGSPGVSPGHRERCGVFL